MSGANQTGVHRFSPEHKKERDSKGNLTVFALTNGKRDTFSIPIAPASNLKAEGTLRYEEGYYIIEIDEPGHLKFKRSLSDVRQARRIFNDNKKRLLALSEGRNVPIRPHLDT